MDDSRNIPERIFLVSIRPEGRISFHLKGWSLKFQDKPQIQFNPLITLRTTLPPPWREVRSIPFPMLESPSMDNSTLPYILTQIRVSPRSWSPRGSFWRFPIKYPAILNENDIVNQFSTPKGKYWSDCSRESNPLFRLCMIVTRSIQDLSDNFDLKSHLQITLPSLYREVQPFVQICSKAFHTLLIDGV